MTCWRRPKTEPLTRTRSFGAPTERRSQWPRKCPPSGEHSIAKSSVGYWPRAPIDMRWVDALLVRGPMPNDYLTRTRAGFRAGVSGILATLWRLRWRGAHVYCRRHDFRSHRRREFESLRGAPFSAV